MQVIELLNSIYIYSPKSVRRAGAIGLLTASSVVFGLSIIFDINWSIGWICLLFALIFEFSLSMLDIVRVCYSIDSALFCIGMLVFTVLDPNFLLITGSGFPGVDGKIYFGNEVGNLTGFVVCIFCLCFYIGRFFVRYEKARLAIRPGDYGVLSVVKTPILLMAFIVSILAYLMNGQGLSIQNLLNSLAARASGYVAFASSALGSQNPILSLFGQSIPVTVILWILSVKERNWKWKLLASIVSIGLLFLYAALGGRSGIVIVFCTIGIYLLVRQRNKFGILTMPVLVSAAILIISFQINYRDYGKLSEGLFQRSPFAGFALNREIAFIIDNYGEKIDFINDNNFFIRALSPIPDTFILFITNPIPRKIWPNKPIDPSFGPYNKLRTGNTGFGTGSNITPTIPGRFYMNYGLVGVAQAGVVFGVLWGFANRLIVLSLIGDSSLLLIGALFSSVLFTSLRDLAPGKFYPLLFLLLFIYLSKFRYFKNRS